MDFWQQYRAIDARDVRFDGQFVTAVSTTGIYCRPSCPARTPKPTHVTFYRTSAAAHEAGYRACKRCLPEAVPGNPHWNLRSDVSARAMRLIADGEVDRAGVPGLAARLGYSTRQLNRVLREELGAGALALARAQRAQTARTLLTGSTLKASDVAFAAGFGSIRQFNDTIQQVFDLTPRQVRQGTLRAPIGRTGPGDPVRIFLRLPARLPYDNGIFRFLADRAVDGVELADESAYERILRLPGGPAWFRALPVEARTNGQAALPVTVSVTGLSDLPLLLGRIRRIFDLDADPVAVDAALGRDAHFRALAATTPGIRLPGTPDLQESLVRAVLEDRLLLGAARSTLSRLAEAGPPIELPGTTLNRFFPDAEQLAGGALLVLEQPGPEAARPAVAGPHVADPVPAPSAEPSPSRIFPTDVLSSVADSLLSGALELSIGAESTVLRAQLLEHTGISSRTADHVLLHGLGDPDVLLDDAAVRTGWERLLDGPTKRPPGRITRTPAALGPALTGIRPWRSYATMQLRRTGGAVPRRAPAGRVPGANASAGVA